MNNIERFSPDTPRGRYEHHIAKTVLKDFYLSFKFSQGSAADQHIIFDAIGACYSETFGDDDKQVLNDHLPRLNEKITRLRPPAQHTSIVNKKGVEDKESITRSLRQEWEQFKSPHLIQLVDQVGQQSRLNDGILSAVAERIIDKDFHYTCNTRPNRQATDSRESFFREHVLNGRSTGSETYDYIFHKMGTMALTPDIAEGLSELSRAWMRNHPGEDFYSS